MFLTFLFFFIVEDFQPNQSSDDDEETIAKAEEELKSVTNHKEEVELLKKESEIPLEDLLKDLPPDYLEDRSKSLSPPVKETIEDVCFQFYICNFRSAVILCLTINFDIFYRKTRKQRTATQILLRHRMSLRMRRKLLWNKKS